MTTIRHILEEAGFTLKSSTFLRGQFEYNNAVPGGISFSDDCALILIDHVDMLGEKSLRDYVRQRCEGAKARKQAAAEREKAKREQQERDRLYQEARQREIQQKQDDAIRARIIRANPFATPQQVEALLPKVREAEMLKRTLEGADDYRKADLSKWGAE
jgi:hypothetical protein